MTRILHIPGDIDAIETDSTGAPVGIGPAGVTQAVDVTHEHEEEGA